MITRDELVTYLHAYLHVDMFQDYAPNGLQVEGRHVLKHICTAVTASEAVIQEACARGADALLVHHGFFWRGEESIVRGMKRRRLKHLLIHDLNLLAYHLPLDCHLELGNNACLAKQLGCVDVQTHTQGKTPHLLWSGYLPQPLTVDDFAWQLSKIFHRAPLHVTGGAKTQIKSIAWCSGGAQDFLDDAARLNVDAYLSGEISERTYYQAQELGVHYFACGHHATERYGIQALGEHLQSQFGCQHTFIDSDNPV